MSFFPDNYNSSSSSRPSWREVEPETAFMRQDPSPCHRSVLSHRDTFILFDHVSLWPCLYFFFLTWCCSALVFPSASTHSLWCHSPQLFKRAKFKHEDIVEFIVCFFCFLIINMLGVFRCQGTQWLQQGLTTVKVWRSQSSTPRFIKAPIRPRFFRPPLLPPHRFTLQSTTSLLVAPTMYTGRKSPVFVYVFLHVSTCSLNLNLEGTLHLI